MNVTTSTNTSVNNGTGPNDVFDAATLIYGIIIPVVVLFGFMGNILTAIVLWKKQMASVNNLLLRALVLSDISMITIIFIFESLPFLLTKLLDNELAIYSILMFGHSPISYLVMTTQQCNEYILVSVSVERYFAVCHPLKYANFTSKRKTIVVICGVVCFSIVYNIPRLLETTWYQPPCIIENFSVACFEGFYTEFGEGYFYNEVYLIWLYGATYFVLPLAILLIMNILIIKKLAEMRSIRVKLGVTGASSANKDNITLSLVLIMVVFGFVQTLGFFNQFPNFIADGIDTYTFIRSVNALYAVNSSINFLIYVVVGKKFRKTVSELLKTCFNCSPCTNPSEDYRLTDLPSSRN